MKTKFRIGKEDTIKATAYNSEKRNILATIYDSGYTKIEQVINELYRKIPHYTGKKIEITIYNQDKEKIKHITRKVNQ